MLPLLGSDTHQSESRTTDEHAMKTAPSTAPPNRQYDCNRQVDGQLFVAVLSRNKRRSSKRETRDSYPTPPGSMVTTA